MLRLEKIEHRKLGETWNNLTVGYKKISWQWEGLKSSNLWQHIIHLYSWAAIASSVLSQAFLLLTVLRLGLHPFLSLLIIQLSDPLSQNSDLSSSQRSRSKSTTERDARLARLRIHSGTSKYAGVAGAIKWQQRSKRLMTKKIKTNTRVSRKKKSNGSSLQRHLVDVAMRWNPHH